MFFRCDYLTSLDLSKFDTGNVTDMGYMFGYCLSLASLDVSRFNTSNVTNMSYMFASCSGLSSLDVSGFDTGNVTNMEGMFSECSGLKSLDLSSFKTDNVTTMSQMFSRCSGLTSLDLRHFNTGNVLMMNSMFGSCMGLTSLNVSSFNTSNVVSMIGMFAGCSALTSLDLSSFDTGKVKDMSQMFYKCSSLPTVDLKHFKTGKVTKMSQMFSECSALKTMDLSGFDTGNVTTMDRLFEKCPKLTSVNLSGLNTSAVTSIRDMFVGCSSLTSLDLSSFDTGDVIDMYRMFSGCSKLSSLDLSSFDTSKVSLMTDMFKCDNLREIKLGNKFTKWIQNAYLPEGTWVNGALEKTETELYNEYPNNTAAYTGTWVRKGVEPVPVEPEVTRVSGSDRYATSMKAADQLKELMGVDKFDAVVLTTGKSFADALAGSYLANHNNAPILLINQKNAPAVTDYINKNLKDNGKVYILGGASAVEDSWFAALNTANIERVFGKDRYKTDLEILKKAGYTGGNLLVCVGKSVNASGADTAFADSLSVSAVDIPILLVDKKGLKADQIEFLKSLSTTPNFYVIGGEGAVPENVVQELTGYGNFVKRVSGKNRYATSAAIAREFFSKPEKAVLSYGENFPDGLSGGALAYRLHAPLVLTISGNDKGKDTSGKRQWAVDYCTSASITSGIVMGGSSLIDDESAALIFSSVTSR
ncbi:MAG: BspA family leucine-rich repeat surface protein [Erysipelotrichaceae bacterium]|nr:BspA family leucine-rich repeat surface protein [Erysipelotrichaceae bacterium]